MLGQAAGSHELHYLLEDPFDNDGGDLSDTFLYQVAALTGFATAPLYAVLHEACYGGQGEGTRWAAQRVRSEFPEFDARAALEAGAPVMFTGEMIYPWMFDLDPALRPLREAAEILANAGTTGRRCTTRRGSRSARCPPRRRSTSATCTCRSTCRCARRPRSAG